MEKYISNIITDQDLSKVSPGYFNILRAPRGYGKTTFMFDDRILNFARAKKHVIYLIHNKDTRDLIAAEHADKARVYENTGFSAWLENRRGSSWIGNDEDYVHVMCYQTFAALLRKEGTAWLSDIELIVWDEFDDIKNFYEKEIKDIKKKLPAFSKERITSLVQEGNPNSVVNFIYQIKTHILDPKEIRLLAISATPENAAYYFSDYVNYILEGRLQEKYAAQETIFIEDVCNALHEGVFEHGRIYWCFTKYIHDGFRISLNANSVGFNSIVLWKEDNEDWKHLMDDTRRQVLRTIKNEKRAPDGYDFIIITAVASRSWNIYDTNIQDWICNSTDYEDVGQYMRARFSPARQYLLEQTRGLVEFTQNGYPVDYYQWHTLDELRKLIIKYPFYSKDMCNRKQLATFNAVRKEYPELFESRRYGKARLTQYRIKPAV